MIYCSLDDAFGNEYINDDTIYPTVTRPTVVEPKVVQYTCYDFREHIQSCSHCSNVLAETRNQFYKQEDGTSNMIILFLILLLIWSMTSKN
jgi:hypothetical protein